MPTTTDRLPATVERARVLADDLIRRLAGRRGITRRDLADLAAEVDRLTAEVELLHHRTGDYTDRSPAAPPTESQDKPATQTPKEIHQ